MKIKMRPVYSELQGLLSQVPLSSVEPMLYNDNNSLWNQLNGCIKELNDLTSIDYGKFSISPKVDEQGYSSVTTDEYRTKLGGLISRIHAEYFNDEPSPFSGSPSTVIQQSQTQQQSVSVVLLLEIQSKIDEKLNSTKDEKEKGFLQNLKKALPNVKSGLELFKLMLELGKQFGLDTEHLARLLS